MEQVTGLAHELMDMVRREAEVTRRLFHEQWGLPISERVLRGRCIDGLEFEPSTSERFLRFRCTRENHSDFREGDFVRLSGGDPTAPVLNGTLYRVEDERISFHVFMFRFSHRGLSPHLQLAHAGHTPRLWNRRIRSSCRLLHRPTAAVTPTFTAVHLFPLGASTRTS